jgi:hypothetical protein
MPKRGIEVRVLLSSRLYELPRGGARSDRAPRRRLPNFDHRNRRIKETRAGRTHKAFETDQWLECA